MLKNGTVDVRLGHILAHIKHQENTFNLLDCLNSAQVNAVWQIKRIRSSSEEMNRQEVRPLYENYDMYGAPYPNDNREYHTEDWVIAFYALLREAAITYTIMAGRCSELNEALEYSNFAISLWSIHTELVRGVAINELREQIGTTLEDWN